MARSPGRKVFLLVVLGVVLDYRSSGQITNVTNDQSTPIPGAGHDYIEMLNETVNLSNGSVSLRLHTPTPLGRGFSLPFSFNYDSNGIHHFFASSNGHVIWTNDSNLLEVGGWSYSIPVLSDSLVHLYSTSHPGKTCDALINYVFRDPSGSRHAFATLSIGNKTLCNSQFVPFVYSASGSDTQYAAFTDPSATYDLSPFTVRDGHGTIYHFPALANTGCAFIDCSLPDYIEDRNGNLVTIDHPASSTFTVKDSLERNVIAVSGFGADGNTVAVSGQSSPYTLHWASEPVNYSVQPNIIFNGDGSCTINPVQGSVAAVTSIALPNGKDYQLFYDSAFGVVNKVVYPSGGYVRYVWSLNQNSDYAVWLDNSGGSNSCIASYGAPVVAHRYVSFDGATEAIKQDFSYSTTRSGNDWTSKTTTVTTKDLLQQNQPSFLTIYTYLPSSVPRNPNTGSAKLVTVASTVPVENTITHKNWDGSILQTVTKGWQNPYLMTSEQVALENGQTAKTTYGYGPFGVITEKDEYDYGPGSVGLPLRKTITNYASFPLTVLGASIADKPCQAIVYDGSTNRVAETDYLYDGGTTVCGVSGTPSVTGISNLTGHDEINYGPMSTAPRGNLTQKTQWLNSGTSPVTTYTYDETGQLLSMKDPCGNGTCSDMTGTNHTTTYSYADSYTSGTPPGNTNAYLTQITSPTTSGASHVKNFSYGYADGQLTVLKDENAKPTNYKYNTPPSGCSFTDGLDRLAEIDYPDGGKTTYCYNDSPYNFSTPSPSVTTSRAIASGSNEVRTAAFDGVGHSVKAILSSDPDGTTYSVTGYDGTGKSYQVYNPTRCNPPTTNCGAETTWGITTYTYDALGRTTQVAEPDGSNVSTMYSGNQTTVTDEVGNQRTSQTDGLGRLTYVWEAPKNTGYNYETDYAYDPLGNLLNVNQKGGSSNSANWRTRTFTYDSLSRLLCAANPEVQIVTCPSSATGTFPTGAITYTYDLNSNLSTKTQPIPNNTTVSNYTTNYSYDALNRLTNKTYTGMTGPSSLYAYDGTTLSGCPGPVPPTITFPTNLVGRRSSMCTTKSSSSWDYDPMGRPVDEARTNKGSSTKTYTVSYVHNLDGSLKLLAYPSGKSVTYTVGAAGRATQVDNTFNVFAASISYTPSGSLAAGVEGPATITNAYSNRLQPILLSASSANSTFSLCFDFHLGVAVNSPPCSFAKYTTGDNGNVFQVLNNVDSTRSAAFAYDPLNRISQANTTTTTGANCWGETYTIDAWGNLYNRGGVTGMSGCHTEGLSATVTTKNQLGGIGMLYDAAGNVTNDGNGNQPTYDTENRIATDAGVTYSYDADGFRMEKSSGTMYWPDTGGEVLAETDLSGAIKEEYVYFNGQRIARIDRPSGTIHYYSSDHLGSTGVITDVVGNVQEQYYYYPYGGLVSSIGTDPNHYKFTGKERDTESGLDNFGARYFGSSMGRFMTPDPPLMDQHIADPQSWNLYSYVRNNPLSLVDPDGNAIELLCSGSDASKCAAERQKELQFLQKSLGKDKAASNLYINEVKDGDKTRYFVGIKGDVGDFMKMGATSHDLANLVENKNIVQFGLTSNDLTRFGGAVTYEIGENGKNEHPQVFVNPDQVDVANRVLNSNSVLGASRFGGQFQDPRWRVNPFTPGVMAWHEFGHAWGYINGRPLDRTNPEAFAWENRMREQLYGPIGPNNAPRTAH